MQKYLVDIISQYGEETGINMSTISSQVLEMLGVDIYIDNNKIVEIERYITNDGIVDEVCLYESDGSFSVLFIGGEIQKDL